MLCACSASAQVNEWKPAEAKELSAWPSANAPQPENVVRAPKVEEIKAVSAPAPAETKVGAVTVPAAAQPAPPKIKEAFIGEEPAVASLKAWDAKLKTLQTNFKQVTYYDDGTGEPMEVNSSSGVLYYLKPNNLKLEMLNKAGAIEQTVVTDKKNIYSTASDVPLKFDAWVAGQPLSALFDFGNYSALIAKYHVKNVDADGKNTKITLEPPARDHTLHIITGADYFPTQIILEMEDVKTTADLSQTQKNIEIKKDIFILPGAQNAK